MARASRTVLIGLAGGGVMSLSGLWVLNRARAVARRAARCRRRDLVRELADYNTPAQRCDLEATLDRYPEGVTHELRDILAGQAAARDRRRLPAMSYRT